MQNCFISYPRAVN